MAKICCVDGCSSAIEGIFFKFPNSRTLRRKWMDVITTSKKLPDDSLVCSHHFLEDQYEVVRGKTRLKAKVVPSLLVRVKPQSPEKIITSQNSSILNKTSEHSNNDNSETLGSIETLKRLPDLPPSENCNNDSSITEDNKTNASDTVNNLPGKSPKLKKNENVKKNGDITPVTQRTSDLSDIENKDIEDIITNYHIKQIIPNRLHSPERDLDVTDAGQNNTQIQGDKDVIEIIDEHATEPQFIEISTDKGQTDQADGQDCLMVLENVQVEVDPNLMFPTFEEDDNSKDSDVIDLGEKKEDPISLLTSSDEDEVIIEEPNIDTVEVSDETDEDDVPLVKLVKTKSKSKPKNIKSKSKYSLQQLMWGTYEYYCMECHYTTTNSIEFKKHKNTHSTIFEVCQICNYTTASKSQFIRHKRKHKFERRYQCHICEYKAKHHMSLIYHLKSHNTDSYKCQKCGFITSVKSEYLKHIKQCCIKKCYKCDQCKYQTLRRSDLKEHRIRIHKDCDDELDTDYTPG